MARMRIYEWGPTVQRGGRSAGRGPSQITTSVVRRGVNRGGTARLRVPTSLYRTTTRKTTLKRKDIRGIQPPGLQPYNYLESSIRT